MTIAVIDDDKGDAFLISQLAAREVKHFLSPTEFDHQRYELVMVDAIMPRNEKLNDFVASIKSSKVVMSWSDLSLERASEAGFRTLNKQNLRSFFIDEAKK